MSAPICSPRIVTTGMRLLRIGVTEHDDAAGEPLL
jgi:hypothetical protein